MHEFADGHFAGAFSFRGSIIQMRHLFANLVRNFFKMITGFLVIAIAARIHQIPHHITDDDFARDSRLTNVAAAGAITLLFRKLRQPLVLGYLIAGVLVGPYTLPILPEADIHNISLLAEIGLVLILFRMGLEFSWGKIRHVGFSILMIGVIEIDGDFLIGIFHAPQEIGVPKPMEIDLSGIE